jgi:hypothetical protein
MKDEMDGHVACMGETRNAYNIWVENLKGRDYFEYIGVDRNILEWFLGK